MDEKKDKIINKYDLLLLLLIITVSVITVMTVKATRKEGYRVRITCDGEILQTMPIDKNTEYIFNSENGTNTVIIKDGCAYVVNADCPDKVCEEYEPIDDAGEVIICLPHKLVVEVIK